MQMKNIKTYSMKIGDKVLKRNVPYISKYGSKTQPTWNSYFVIHILAYNFIQIIIFSFSKVNKQYVNI